MCGRLPTTPSVLLPQRVAHDSRRERARRGLPCTNSGYAHPDISGVAKGVCDAAVHHSRPECTPGQRGRQTPAEATQHVQRSASDAEACALERGRTQFHRRARDDRSAGHRGPRVRRRGRRTHRCAWRLTAGNSGGDRQRPDLGRLFDRPRHCGGSSGRSRPGLYRCHRGPPPTHRRHRKTRPGDPGHAHRARRRAGAVPVVCPRTSGEQRRGTLANAGATTEKTAARKAARTTTSRRS